jgi:hypothetical protein
METIKFQLHFKWRSLYTATDNILMAVIIVFGWLAGNEGTLLNSKLSAT